MDEMIARLAASFIVSMVAWLIAMLALGVVAAAQTFTDLKRRRYAERVAIVLATIGIVVAMVAGAV